MMIDGAVSVSSFGSLRFVKLKLGTLWDGLWSKDGVICMINNLGTELDAARFTMFMAADLMDHMGKWRDGSSLKMNLERERGEGQMTVGSV